MYGQTDIGMPFYYHYYLLLIITLHVVDQAFVIVLEYVSFLQLLGGLNRSKAALAHDT